MSNNTNIPNEDELWDLLSQTPSAEPKSKSPVAEPAPEPKPEAPVSEPAAEPKAVPVAAEPKQGQKIDKFFITCMACVAAVSVAVTAAVCSLTGGSAPAAGTDIPEVTESAVIAQLEQENAELKAQLQLQMEQVKELQKDLITLMGSEEYLSTISTDPEENNESLENQLLALDTLAKIQEAYTNFDRDALEELIPQMDALLSYLTPEALSDYYMILEYVEMPSNG